MEETKYSEKGKKILLHFYIIIIGLHTIIYKKALVISVVCISATVLLVSLNNASSPLQLNSPSYLQVFAQDQEVPFKVQEY